MGALEQNGTLPEFATLSKHFREAIVRRSFGCYIGRFKFQMQQILFFQPALRLRHFRATDARCFEVVEVFEERGLGGGGVFFVFQIGLVHGFGFWPVAPEQATMAKIGSDNILV